MDAKHFSHHHGLVLHRQPPHQGPETRCSGCKTALSGEAYVCWQCNYFLHVQCFRATRSLKHPSHPLHPLTLLPSPTYPSASFICNLCNLTGDGFSYSCSACQFDIHVHCAHLNNNNPLVPSSPIAANPNYKNNPVYHPPLHTSPYPTYPPSNYQQSYPPQPQLTAYPPNPNSPYPSYPTPPPNNTQHYNAFHQTPGVHQNPAFPQPHSIPPPQQYIPPANNPLPPPQPNITVPTYATVMNTTTDNPPPPPPNNPQPKPPTNIIKHFSHAHALKLIELDGKSSKICSACEFRLSGSAYCCTEGHCPFSLHKSCYDAPREFQHKSHLQHTLTLIPSPPYSDGFTCNACLKDGKAFAYTCATCSYDLHIDCVQWPEKAPTGDWLSAQPSSDEPRLPSTPQSPSGRGCFRAPTTVRRIRAPNDSSGQLVLQRLWDLRLPAAYRASQVTLGLRTAANRAISESP
ncbi:Cysteine/Histidine-rich C1 domain family protein [Striga hermonthica]|uniref:Cysteine/Histidine-rich C1 domain family protein n=1 Tax=Striga hermonthica TaxID=68872 RepID=A0A9N7N549_STRHE|nr:Cysteine/Histidine-rich C1 domain family protein [Striga hermonthica]